MDADDLLTDNAADLFDAARDCSEDIVFHSSISRMSNDLSILAHRMDDYQKLFDQYALDGDEAPFRFQFCILVGKLFRRDFSFKGSHPNDFPTWEDSAHQFSLARYDSQSARAQPIHP